MADNGREEILAATKELLEKMIEANDVGREMVACIFFTATPDLNAEFPALAARLMGWKEVPLLCGREMEVAGSLARCLRILMLFNTEKKAEDIDHVYIRGAEVLRQDPVNPGG